MINNKIYYKLKTIPAITYLFKNHILKIGNHYEFTDHSSYSDMYQKLISMFNKILDGNSVALLVSKRL